MFRHIFVAVKFTAASRSALEKGVRLARFHQAALTVYHCQDYRLVRLEPSHPDRVDANRTAAELYEAQLKPLVADVADVAFSSEPGDPAMSVCRQARKCGADLIILGCHQHGHKLSLGRVDYVGITILEKAHCPVMLVPLADDDPVGVS